MANETKKTEDTKFVPTKTEEKAVEKEIAIEKAVKTETSLKPSVPSDLRKDTAPVANKNRPKTKVNAGNTYINKDGVEVDGTTGQPISGPVTDMTNEAHLKLDPKTGKEPV
jgi:hypothetical protein